MSVTQIISNLKLREALLHVITDVNAVSRHRNLMQIQRDSVPLQTQLITKISGIRFCNWVLIQPGYNCY